MNADAIALGREAIEVCGVGWTRGALLYGLTSARLLYGDGYHHRVQHVDNQALGGGRWTLTAQTDGGWYYEADWGDWAGYAALAADPNDQPTIGALLAHLRALLDEPRLILYWFPEGVWGAIRVEHDKHGSGDLGWPGGVRRTHVYGEGPTEFAALVDAAKRHLGREGGSL